MKHLGKWWHQINDQNSEKKFQCDLCPRECQLKPGQRGFCFVREAGDDGIYLTTYGRSSGFCIDPIEKKPLNHFYPGSSILSFGTAGCNLGCKFCQNWDISKAKSNDRLQSIALPSEIAKAALKNNCKSVAFTYNDPVIFAEYAIDTAIECHKLGLKTVAVSAGYINPEARIDFYQHMDAANIDLKGFTEDFYRKITFSSLAPVLDTLKFIKQKTKTWLEVTTLLIPGLNDSEQELDDMTKWFFDNLGPDTPLHFSAFHPDFKMHEIPPTPVQTVIHAREIAMQNGLKYVYTGNIIDEVGENTYCPSCSEPLIVRDTYAITKFHLQDGKCPTCHIPIAGHFSKKVDHWGNRRKVIQIS